MVAFYRVGQYSNGVTGLAKPWLNFVYGLKYELKVIKKLDFRLSGYFLELNYWPTNDYTGSSQT